MPSITSTDNKGRLKLLSARANSSIVLFLLLSVYLSLLAWLSLQVIEHNRAASTTITAEAESSQRSAGAQNQPTILR